MIEGEALPRPELSGTVLHTPRLALRHLVAGDAEFVLSLLNEPAWLRFIGDRGVRTAEAARDYIATGPQKMYRERGFGLWLVERRDTAQPIGICGLIKRPALADVDLGFAYCEKFWGRGYAHEAAAETLRHAREGVGLKRVVAITSPDNERSMRLLERLGFRFERTVRLAADGPESRLHGVELG